MRQITLTDRTDDGWITWSEKGHEPFPLRIGDVADALEAMLIDREPFQVTYKA